MGETWTWSWTWTTRVASRGNGRRVGNVRSVAVALLALASACGPAFLNAGDEAKIVALMQSSAGPAIDSLKATASFAQRSEKGLLRGDAYLFFRRPSSLRIELLGGVDNPVGLFVSREGRGLLLDYWNGAAYESADARCLFSRLLGAGLALPDFTGILTGQPPLIAFEESELKASAKGYSILSLKGKGGVGEKIQLVSGQHGPVALRAVFTKGGKKVADLSFRQRGWKSDIAPLIPRIVEIGFPREKVQIVFTYKKMSANVKFPDELFDLAPPEGFSPVAVECGSEG